MVSLVGSRYSYMLGRKGLFLILSLAFHVYGRSFLEGRSKTSDRRQTSDDIDCCCICLEGCKGAARRIPDERVSPLSLLRSLLPNQAEAIVELPCGHLMHAKCLFTLLESFLRNTIDRVYTSQVYRIGESNSPLRSAPQCPLCRRAYCEPILVSDTRSNMWLLRAAEVFRCVRCITTIIHIRHATYAFVQAVEFANSQFSSTIVDWCLHFSGHASESLPEASVGITLMSLMCEEKLRRCWRERESGGNLLRSDEQRNQRDEVWDNFRGDVTELQERFRALRSSLKDWIKRALHC